MKLSTVVHTYNSSTQETMQEDLELKARLSYIKITVSRNDQANKNPL
jgi:hypothetical protein